MTIGNGGPHTVSVTETEYYPQPSCLYIFLIHFCGTPQLVHSKVTQLCQTVQALYLFLRSKFESAQ